MNEKPEYSGMTVNERLSEAGLLPEWDAAARSRNRERMIDLLGKVDLANQAEWIADTILSKPGKYGF
jgi:hypothetical protein